MIQPRNSHFEIVGQITKLAFRKVTYWGYILVDFISGHFFSTKVYLTLQLCQAFIIIPVHLISCSTAVLIGNLRVRVKAFCTKEVNDKNTYKKHFLNSQKKSSFCRNVQLPNCVYFNGSVDVAFCRLIGFNGKLSLNIIRISVQ